jgi:predicted ATP-binding protein involved in virulence
MRLKQIDLINFRGITGMKVDFDPFLNVFAGMNGAGKSTLLDAVAIMLSWVTARVRSPQGQGRHIGDLDIRNGTNSSAISLTGTYSDKSFEWALAKVRKGFRKKEGDKATDLSDLSRFVEFLQGEIAACNGTCSIPLLVYYPVNRSFAEIPLRIRRGHDFSLLDTYDQSLTGTASFRTFFEWFRNREDLENENLKYRHAFIQPDGWEYPDRQLQAVREAMKVLLSNFSNLSVRRNPLHMVVSKGSRELWINQLSDGEKCLIAMIGDLARRLAIANPTVQAPLAGKGVVLIDEIDLHLHPSWQRKIIPRMREAFPNCQLFVSTHSPQLLSEIDPANIWLLQQNSDSGEISYIRPDQTFGLESGEILEYLMETKRRNFKVDESIKAIFGLIDQDEFEEARKEIVRLKELVHGNLPDLVRAEAMITMLDGDSEAAR